MPDTSHDILADRRFAWAEAMAAEGDDEAAADILDQVVERVPDWAPGWVALAQARARLGDADAALAAWRHAAALDPDGRLGAALHIARQAAEIPAAMPPAYVRALFDDYAPRFDRHLVETLAYRGPAVVMAGLDRVAPGRRFGRALDLGCGTGLMGLALAGRIDTIDGIDLSPAMVEAARRTGAYARLGVGGLEEALSQDAALTCDLVTAADVLVYVGDLAPVLHGARGVLVPGGLFAFTLQTLSLEASKDYELGADLRFAHAPAYVDATTLEAGLEPVLMEAVSTRTERGADVPGLLVLARRP